jgi:hypothetical protein
MKAKSPPPFFWSLIAGIVLAVIWMLASTLSSPASTSTAAVTAQETEPTRPYASVAPVRLGTIILAPADAPDVYVRLIAIDGEVLLPTADSQ